MSDLNEEKQIDTKVSVIIPVYNSAEFIGKCLESLKNQTLKNIEIICVNDGSTDNSLEILQEYAKQDDRIVVLSQENKRQGGARNYGISIAKGEYIGFVDSDDWVDEDYFEKLYNAASKYGTDITVANIIKHKKTRLKKIVANKNVRVATDIQDKIKLCNDCKKRFFYCMNKLYKKDLLRDVKFPEHVFYEDVLFSIETIYKSDKIVTVPDAWYHYWSHGSSTVKSKSNSEKKNEDGRIARESLETFAKEHNIKLNDKFNYSKKEWINPFVKKMSGLYYEKYMLFGILPLKKVTK